MKTPLKTFKLEVAMSPIRMLKLFSATAVVGFSVADAHAAWFCPTCHVKHEEAICPNANTTDKFGIWQPTWWCDACKAIHFPKQWWWDGEQLLVTCENGCWPCQTCNAVHIAEDAFTQNAWCCPTCRTKHTGGQLYCEKKQGNNEKKVWFCTSCNKPHGTYKPCESAWFCDACKKGHLIGTICPTGRWYCSACQKSYEENESCEHSWNCSVCHGSYAIGSPCVCGTFYCQSENLRLKTGENSEHYWYCNICKIHHAANSVCTATTPHRWYCPNEACRASYEIGKACGHFWYCEGCQTLHALDATCPEGYLYCANEDCKKVLTVTESCLHYWVCPGCVKTHHAAEDTCPNGYWFCIDCFTTDPTTGIYKQTEGCSHHWWCKDCNENAGMRYAADDVCDHRWGCSVDKIGHTDTEKCDARLWYCRGDGCNCRYNSQDTACCNHTWYCPHHQYGHNNTDGSCETHWYCPDENKIHAVEDATYCDHSWYCTECHKGHLLTEACLQGYWFCKTCHAVYNSNSEDVPLSDDDSWYCYIDENNPGCKVGHLKTETCTQHYRWCGEEGCNCVYPPNTPCVHCWECPTCYQAYGRNEACPTDQTWCCGCSVIQGSDIERCETCHTWHCTTCHAVKTESGVCPHKWYCEICTKVREISEICEHYWCCNSDQVRNPITQTCSGGCNYWCCYECQRIFESDTDEAGHQRPDLNNRAVLLKTRKKVLKNVSPLVLTKEVSGKNVNRFKDILSSDDTCEKPLCLSHAAEYHHSDGEKSKISIKQAMEKLVRRQKKYKHQGMRKEQKKEKKEDKKHSFSSSSSKDKEPKLRRKREEKPNVQPKELPYPPVHSYIRYSKQKEPKKEEPKQLSPNSSPKINDKSGSSSDPDALQSKRAESSKEEKVPQPSKVKQPILHYNINFNALMSRANIGPLSVSGLSNIENAAKKNEDARFSALQQLSKMQPSSKPKQTDEGLKNRTSKLSEDKEEDKKASSKSRPSETFKPSSSSSDSDASESPKRKSRKNSKVYTNGASDDLRKNGMKKTYKEDETYETPSNSQSNSKFNLLKSSKNKNAAPNASDTKPKLTRISASDEPQHIGFETIKGPYEVSKSYTDTPTPNGETPKNEMLDEDTPKGDEKNIKSDGSASSDNDQKSRRSESSSSHRRQTPKSDNDSSSDKKSSSGRFSKKPLTPMSKGNAQKSDDEKQSASEGSKESDEGDKSDNDSSSDKDKKSSHSKSSQSSSKKSVKFSDGSVKSLAESIENQEYSDKENSKHSDEENEEASEEEDEASETSEK